MEKPLVSIILTSFNQENYIEDAINSVLNQTYKNIECIIIDDGSTDNTSQICNRFIINDSRVHYYFQQNKGVTKARNNGFKIAKGQLIHFLDGDDFLSNDKIEKQLHFLIENPGYDICYSNYSHYFQKDNYYKEAEHSIVDINPLENFLFCWDRTIGTTIHSALFLRSIWEPDELPFEEDYKSRYEDWVFWVNIALKGKKIGHTAFIGAYYRIHGSNITENYESNCLFFFNAMFYLYNRIPMSHRQRFIDENCKFLLNKYHNKRLLNEIYPTLNWKIAKMLNMLFYPFLKYFLKRK